NAQAREALGHDHQRDRLARAGGAGDQAVTVAVSGQQMDGPFALADEDVVHAGPPAEPVGSCRTHIVRGRRTRAPRLPGGVPYNGGARGRCDVSEKADRDDSRDDRSWLDALTKKEEQKLIALLRQRYPQRGDDRRGKTE